MNGRQALVPGLIHDGWIVRAIAGCFGTHDGWIEHLTKRAKGTNGNLSAIIREVLLSDVFLRGKLSHRCCRRAQW